jgi:hypothetical protein
MKLGRPFNKLKFSEYLAFIPMHEVFSDFNTLGLYRSILENEKLTLEQKIEVRDLSHTFFEKQFDFLQLKDPVTYLAVVSLGRELTKADERQLWEEVKVNQQKILAKKRIQHRNFGTYSKHDCGVEDCVYKDIMVQNGSILCEAQIRFDSDKNITSGFIKSERERKERREKRLIIRENLEELD